MEFTEYKRGVLGMKNPDGTSFGFLPETKEECITDDKGTNLSDKLNNLQSQIGNFIELTETDVEFIWNEVFQ